MAKHEIIIRENTGATKEVAPYLGSYVSKETVRLGSYAEQIGQKCGIPAIQVQAAIAGAFETWEKLEKEALVRIHTDLGVICGIITGSFDTSDAAFDATKNALELTLRLEDGIRLALTDVVPSIAQDESLTKLRVDNIVSVLNPRPYNVIYGQTQFRVQGYNMVLTDEGAEVYLETALGAKIPLTVDDSTSKQLVVAHITSAPTPGDYKLVVKSRAGDVAGPLQTAIRRVKVVQYTFPTVVVSYTENERSEHDILNHVPSTLKIRGQNMKILDGNTVTLRDPTQSGTDHVLPVVYSSDTLIEANISQAVLDDANFWENGAEVVIKSQGGIAGAPVQTVTHQIAITAAG